MLFRRRNPGWEGEALTPFPGELLGDAGTGKVADSDGREDLCLSKSDVGGAVAVALD